jgi:hypothetical protein
MTTLPRDVPSQDATAVEPQGPVPSLPEEARLRELFRLWMRDGHLHPLIHLIRQFRSKDPE